MERFERLLIFLHVNERVAPIQKDHAVARIDFLGLLQLGDGLFVASQLIEHVRDIDEHAEVGWIERGRPAKLVQCGFQLAIADEPDTPFLIKDGARRVAFRNGFIVLVDVRIGTRRRFIHGRHR